MAIDPISLTMEINLVEEGQSRLYKMLQGRELSHIVDSSAGAEEFRAPLKPVDSIDKCLILF